MSESRSIEKSARVASAPITRESTGRASSPGGIAIVVPTVSGAAIRSSGPFPFEERS